MPNSKTARRRHDIVTLPLAQQLTKLTMPMLFSILAIMSIGLVDSYFISHLGTNQLAAIGFIAPIASVIQNLGLAMGMAISSLTSKLIGGERFASAAQLITHGFYLTAILSIIAVALLSWQLTPLFSAMGANQSILPHIHSYMFIWLFAAPVIMFNMVGSSTFRAIGDTTTSAQIGVAMTAINLILDPLLIFGIGPFPELGMLGAAVATLIAVICSFAIGLHKLAFREKLLLFTLPSWQSLKEHLKPLSDIAIPAVVANAIVPITALLLTYLVANFNPQAVAGFGVGNRIEAISLIVVYALSATLPMFVGQNLGANQPQRVLQACKLAFRFCWILQLIVYLLLLLFAKPIATAFSTEASVQQVIQWFLWIIPLSYGLSGTVILINVLMNVLGKPFRAVQINLFRLFLFYLPLAYLGSQLYGLKGLFMGVCIGNLAVYILARYLFNKTLQENNIC